MKQFFSICLFLISSLIYANDSIRVVGVGSTEKSALDNAFVEAVQIYAGTAVGSGLEVKNGKISAEEVKLYSSGYVEKFQIISNNKTANGFSIVVDVWLKSSFLWNYRARLDNNKQEIDTDSLNARINSFLQERQDLDSLISKTLVDFPRKGLTSKVKKVEFYFDGARTPTIAVSSEVIWNQDYILSLKETLNLIKGEPEYFDLGCLCNKSSKQIALTFFAKPNDWYAKTEMFHIRDFGIYEDIVSNFNVQPKLILTLFDTKDDPVISKCFETSRMFTRVDKFKDVLYINTAIQENLKLTFPISTKELAATKTAASVKIATAKSCKV